MTWLHRCMIVPAEQVELARLMCATLAGAGGEGMFTTPLSADGAFPPSHYISSGLIEDAFADLMPLLTVTEDGIEVTSPGNPALVAQLAQQAGLSVTEDEIATLFAESDITDHAPEAVLARLSLMLANPEGDTA